MAIFVLPCTVAGVRRVLGRTDAIAFVTFPGIPLANSHFVAAAVISIAAIAGVAIGYLIYGRRLRPVPGLQPIHRLAGEGLFAEAGATAAASYGLLPFGRALRWVEGRVLDGGYAVAGDSLAFATNPRRALSELPARQLAIGVVTAALIIALVGVLLGSRLGGSR
jgi:hypothetical protein